MIVAIHALASPMYHIALLGLWILAWCSSDVITHESHLIILKLSLHFIVVVTVSEFSFDCREFGAPRNLMTPSIYLYHHSNEIYAGEELVLKGRTGA